MGHLELDRPVVIPIQHYRDPLGLDRLDNALQLIQPLLAQKIGAAARRDASPGLHAWAMIVVQEPAEEQCNCREHPADHWSGGIYFAAFLLIIEYTWQGFQRPSSVVVWHGGGIIALELLRCQAQVAGHPLRISPGYGDWVGLLAAMAASETLKVRMDVQGSHKVLWRALSDLKH